MVGASTPTGSTSGLAAAPKIGRAMQTDFTPGSGNALQASVASALGLSVLDGVPNFVAAPEGYEVALATWLEARALRLCKVKLDEKGCLPLGTAEVGMPCVVRGTSPRGEHGHVVVGRVSGDRLSIELVHDPHPDGTMLRAPLVWCAFFPPMAGSSEAPDGKKRRIDSCVVGVTGASGFIASHIVAQSLERGYLVRGTVRDAGDSGKTSHLWALPGAKEQLKLFSADLLDSNFEMALAGCDGVFHVASPLPMGKGIEDPENLVIKPAVEGTLNVLRACKKQHVKTVVMTSSMSAMAPLPEPSLKSEAHWSDPGGQRERGSFYGAGKTLAEQAAYRFVKEEDAAFRLVSICPTMVVGPMLQPTPNMTMLSLRNWLKDGRPNGRCPNDSMSFVDVRDCASQHINAMEDPEAHGRYMSLESSWHWNDLDRLMKEIYPKMPAAAPCEGTPCRPTQFDLTRQKSLGVELKKVPEILREAAEELKFKALLE
jgi:nucleoside-diphosphate-sugar epimerase